MNRSLVSFATCVACGLFVVSPAPAQQQGQGEEQQAVGTASVRTRENAQTIEVDQHQSPVIAVLYGQQPTETKIMALVSSPDAPQQDKEILFNRENASKRTVVHEGEQAGQAKRIVLIARRGQEDAQIEKITEQPGVMVYGVRKAEPKQPEQQAQQPQGQQQAGQAQDAAAQPAAAEQDPAAAAQQAAAKQKAAEAEAKRKAAEPKPDVYEAIITVYMTTGR